MGGSERARCVDRLRASARKRHLRTESGEPVGGQSSCTFRVLLVDVEAIRGACFHVRGFGAPRRPTSGRQDSTHLAMLGHQRLLHALSNR
jgi:hypothetical protein